MKRRYGFSIHGNGFLGPRGANPRSVLARRFIFTPFSVLDARQGAWQARKRLWKRCLKIKGAAGRFENARGFGSQTGKYYNFYQMKRDLEKELRRKLTTREAIKELIVRGLITKHTQRPGKAPKEKAAYAIGSKESWNKKQKEKSLYGTDETPQGRLERMRLRDGQVRSSDGTKQPRGARSGGVDGRGLGCLNRKFRSRDDEWFQTKRATRDNAWVKEHIKSGCAQDIDGDGSSVFDPVLCELMYRWFCPIGGRVLDPFCGGSTSGMIAGMLGYRFTGIDTRPEQVLANIPQADGIKELAHQPEWYCGDSSEIDKIIPQKRKFDLLWTDPPYFDLEMYGGADRNDGSMYSTYPEFLRWYRRIIRRSLNRLRNNRFAAIKIGEVRGKNGAYLNFVGDTIQMFIDLGLHYYNEIILETAVGSLPVRMSKQFQVSRKIGKTHQNVLIFWKGDLKAIKGIFKDIKINYELKH